ncbi:MAG: HIT family protein [Nanoarchaeota archaeon]
MVSEEELQNMSPDEVSRLQKENCIFCKIVKGEIPSRKVYEDEKMLAILDINPAAKGHTLVMPKEHYPILPVIPPDVFKHLFRTTKYLVAAVKKGMVAPQVTVFIANGAVAGQQSPHFLFHIIPNEGVDFPIPKGKVPREEVAKLTPALRTNVGAVMRNYLQREGKLVGEAKPQVPPTVQVPGLRPPQGMPAPVQPMDELPPLPPEPLPPAPEEAKDNLAKVIMGNPRLKQMLIETPEKIKELMKTNHDLAELFQGINIGRLSQKLREFDKEEQKKDGKKDDGGKDDDEKGDHEGPDDTEDDSDEDRPKHGNPEMDKIAGLFT